MGHRYLIALYAERFGRAHQLYGDFLACLYVCTCTQNVIISLQNYASLQSFKF
jgi:hypothetical protein